VEWEVTVSGKGSDEEVVSPGRQQDSKRSNNILWWIVRIVVCQGDDGYDLRLKVNRIS
jgi:hypothetical protein